MLHIEFETRGNSRMAYRMLSYHALLLEEYNLPVISMIIYPFKTSPVVPPSEERSGDKIVLTFHYQPIALWQFDAQHYIQEHALSMYPLLPTMRGATIPLLQQAIQEMTEYYKGEKLSRRLLWFKTLLGRVQTIPLEDREKVTEEIQMLDEFLEDDPYVQTLVERATQKRVQKFTDQFNAQVAEQARLAIEQANAQAAEQARLVLQW